MVIEEIFPCAYGMHVSLLVDIELNGNDKRNKIARSMWKSHEATIGADKRLLFLGFIIS
jgi:hypothetical protein